MNQQCEIHSIDLSERFYLDDNKQSGFLAKQVKSRLNLDGIEHHFHLGVQTSDIIEEIGGGIDFVILDTTHYYPGELLDFLTLFPYMSPNAIVVVHDVIFNLVFRPDLPTYATKALLDCVIADKYFMPDEISGRETTLPTIAAFKINEDTGKNIVNVFRAVVVKWIYQLEQWQVDSYRNIFTQHYDEECLWLYDSAVKANQIAFGSCVEKPDNSEPDNFIWEDTVGKYANMAKEKEKPVIIYGAGKYAKIVLKKLLQDGYRDCLAGIAVSDISDNPKELEGVLVKSIDQYIDMKKEAHIIIAACACNSEEIKNTLVQKGFINYMMLENTLE